MQDLYDILGVPPDADDRALKSAFRRQARSHHPDVNPGDESAQERFIELAAAFEILSDPERRALYDEFGFEGLREDFDPVRARWERRHREQRQQDESWSARFRREYDVENSSFRSTFEKAFRDFNPFATSGEDVEEHRHDTVFNEPGEDRRGEVTVDFIKATAGGAVTFEQPDGSILTVRIPPGVEDGEELLVQGEGEPSLEGGRPGDLWLTVRVEEHDLFERDELDLQLTLPVTAPEAILGGRVTVPTPHGDCVMTLPEGIHSGAKLRMREMGIHREDEKGDLYVVIQIRSPTFIDDELREAARALERGYDGDVRAKLGKINRKS